MRIKVKIFEEIIDLWEIAAMQCSDIFEPSYHWDNGRCYFVTIQTHDSKADIDVKRLDKYRA